MPRPQGLGVTLLVQSPVAYRGATVPMVNGLLMLPVPASRVLILGDGGWAEEPRVLAAGTAVQSQRRVDAHFYTSNRTRDPLVVARLRRRGTRLPAEFLFDRLMVSIRAPDLVGIMRDDVAAHLEESADCCRWVDRVLAAGDYTCTGAERASVPS